MNARTTQMNYLSPHLIWCADSFFSIFSTLICYLFFHYLVEINIDTVQLFNLLLITVVSSISWTWLCKTYKNVIRHTTIRELMRIVYAMLLKLVTFIVVAYIALDYVGLFVYGIIISDFLFSIFLLVFIRALIVNAYYTIVRAAHNERTLIYGISGSAISLANYLRSNNSQYDIVGFFTRNEREKKYRVMGHKVYYQNDPERFPELFDKLKIKYVLFMNSTDMHADEELINYALHNQISLRIAPLVEAGKSSTNIQLRNVKIEDLLGRDEINLDLGKPMDDLSGHVIMVTGAAGSIGSELCRQLCKINFKQLVLFDFAETGIYEINLELKKTYPGKPIVSVIGDVRNRERVESQIKLFGPDIIFHAAAYKHVPLMEEYPCEAVRTNVLGTSIVADMAVKYNVERFIMVSTDKAVRPSSVMGATKRLAEMYVQSLGIAIRQGKIKGRTSFTTTRFGNVLGSNGSVIPLFRKQILDGGPVTVTHPDIIRYFMTIPEACRLVLEAACLGDGNDIFLFDMGKPVKIADMARRMIELAGLVLGKDIDITYTGLRPGEKLYEELLYSKENSVPTGNPKIFKAICVENSYEEVNQAIRQLIAVAQTDNKLETVRTMKKIVPDFKSQHSVYENLDTTGVQQ